MSKQPVFIAIEFILLCLVFPTLIWTTNSGNAMFTFLWIAFGYTAFIWWRIKDEPKILSVLKTEWNWEAVNIENLKPIFVKWVIGTILICLFTWWYEPERLFYIPREAPHIIPFLLLAYPLLSALPQEFIFCSFFMKQYGPYVEKLPQLSSNHFYWKVFLSAIVFGYAHMLFLNWVAPVFSFFGGLLFAYTYLKTRSLALVTLEHSLYGNSIFLAGIGYYFYSGGIQ